MSTWRLRWTRALALAVLTACNPISPPGPPTPQPFTALYLVKTGPYPLYAEAEDWLADRAAGVSPAQADDLIMTTRRMAEAQNRISPDDGPWLHRGCIFDVERTSADQHDASYVWAYGRVVRCDELITTGLPEPQMGVRPHELRVYDGWLGYFPMPLLEPYIGDPPAPRT